MHFLKFPGIPWNLDVSLLAIIYVAIGFHCKDTIRFCMNQREWKCDAAVCSVAVLLILFCIFNYSGSETWYYFDMKPVFYKELFAAILIPCLFGLVFLRIVYWLRCVGGLRRVQTGLSYLGRMTIPIMFLHVPLNVWKDALGYGRPVFVLIGIGVPVIFTWAFGRFDAMRKLFGLSDVFTKSRTRNKRWDFHELDKAAEKVQR